MALDITQIKNIYSSISLYNKKGKMSMILEPLQSIVQLALISMTPIGTKLTIHDNILKLQIPSVFQPFNRWFYSDKKEDLYFLFQVIKRFIKWYNPNNTKTSPLSIELYNLIINMSLSGLDNLSKTYMASDNTSTNPIIEVLQIYKIILMNNDQIYAADENKYNIDDVFINIIEIYDKNIINIIDSSLHLINNNNNNINYINGLNLLLSEINDKIKLWINHNLSLL